MKSFFNPGHRQCLQKGDMNIQNKLICFPLVASFLGLIAAATSSIAQTLIWPVDAPRVTQDYASYGAVIASKFHTGIDITSAISAANNTQVLAAGAGTVIMANNTCTAGSTTSCGGGWGNYVVIRHNSGLFTLYAHMASVSVSVGAIVSQGQVLGLMGATGNVTAAHIHFDILTSQPSTTSDFGTGYTTDHPANLGHPDPRDYIQRFPITVNTTTLTVRKKPSASEAAVTTVSQGQQFIALAQSANGWYFIFLPSSVIPAPSNLDDDRYGWVSGSFLIVNPTPMPAQVKVSGTLLWAGGATSLRVRSGPSTGFTELTKVWGGQSFVTFGTPTTGTGSTAPWYKINLPANAGASEGWVAGDYLTVSGNPPPCTVTLNSPSSGATIDFPRTFSWTTSGSCANTHLAFAANSSPSTVQVTGQLSGSGIITATDWGSIQAALGASSTYYWAVVSVDGSTFSALTGWRPFYPMSTLVISSVTPTTIQTKDWGESVIYSITVKDGNGNSISGVTVGGEDNVRFVSYNTLPNTTDGNGQITYTTTVPNGKADGFYDITFIAGKSGYNTSSTVTRQVQVLHPLTSFGGSVADSSTGLGIPGATIQWNGQTRTTDSGGGYSFDLVPCGTATLTVSKYGYLTSSQSYTPICLASQVKGISLTPGLSGTARRTGDITDYPVTIQQYGSTPGIINPSPQTWIVIHGRGSSRGVANISTLALAIATNRPDDQVLTLDWSDAAHADNELDHAGENAIINVATWAVSALQSYGLSGSRLNLVGHSWGACVAAEMAQRTTVRVNTVIALDSAENWAGGYDTEDSTVDFSQAQFSWAFHSSLAGSEHTPPRAHEAFIVDTGISQYSCDGIADAHSAVVNFFSYMLGHPSGGVSQFFRLDRLLRHESGPWQLDRYVTSFQGSCYLLEGFESLTAGYEGRIAANVVGGSPNHIKYADLSTGSEITQLETADTVAPTVTISSPTSGQTFTSSPATVSGSASDAGSPSSGLALVEVRVNSGAWQTASGTTSWSRSVNLSSGSNLIEARSRDNAGNYSTIPSVGVTYNPTDTTVPTVTISSPTGGQIFTSSPITVSGNANDPGSPSSGLALVEVRVNSGTWQSASGTASWNTSVSLSSGSNLIEARSRDNAGNYSTIPSVSVTYNPSDTTAPTVAISSPTGGQTFTSSPITVSGSASDPGSPNSGLALVEVRVNSGSWQTASGSTSWSQSVSLSSGSNLIEARSRDNAGNYSTVPSVSVTYNAPTGSSQVNLAPAGAVSAGAQWRVDGGAWQGSGTIVAGLSVGNHTVGFRSVSGWTTPANQIVTINANQTAATTGTYVLIGNRSFQNLNFELAAFVPVVPAPIPGSVDAAAALPGWTLDTGYGLATSILSNNYCLGSPCSAILDSGIGSSIPLVGNYSIPLKGNYTLLLQAGRNPFLPPYSFAPSISQSGLIPSSAKSLSYASSGPELDVTVDGQSLSKLLLSSNANYQTYAVDVSAFAGTLRELKFTVLPLPASPFFPFANVLLDAIAFSTAPLPVTNSVTVQPSPSGRSFMVDGTTYTTAQSFNWIAGSNHTIGATSPQSGGTGIQYVWSGWSDGGAISHTVAPTSSTNYTANFTTQYFLTMNAGTGGGVSPTSAWNDSGAIVPISATASGGYGFSSWTGSGSGSYSGTSNSASVTMNGPIDETANFTLANYTITVNASPSTGGTVGGNGAFPAASPQTVTAIVNNCYAFANWTENGSVVSTSTNYNFTLNSNRDLVANFTLSTYSITTSSSPAAGGSTSGGGTVNCGTSATVTVTPAPCYTFVNWTEGGAPVSSSVSYSFTATGNRTLVANFLPVTYTVTTSASPSAGGTVTGGGLVACGTLVTLTAMANPGYTFALWTENGSPVGGLSASYTFPLTGNRTLVANFYLVPTRIISLSGSLAFGDLAVGASAQRTLTIANTGNSTLTITNITYPSGFSGNWPSGTIPANSSQNVTVSFWPTDLINYGGTVTVNSDQTSGVNTIAALGTGIPAPPFQLSAASVSNGMFRFLVNGPVGRTFVIQVSSNLVNWLPLVTNVIPASGFVLITDPVSGPATRLYRAVEEDTSVTPTNMALVPIGPFTMGDTFGEGGSAELPLHTVYISAFYMDKYEVTKALWDDVYNWGTNHGYSFEHGAQGKTNDHPVHTVTWYDAVKWCNARSEKEGRTPAYYISAAQTTVYRGGETDVQNDWVKGDTGYRLPTEAEWEKAARGGASGERFPWGNTISWSQANYVAYPLSAGGYAYDVNPAEGLHPTFIDGVFPYTSPVEYFAPDGYGLYGMAGNVAEWCWDWYGGYSSGSQTDPRGPASSSYRVDRGGGWSYAPLYCRTAGRSYSSPTRGHIAIGFRCVLPPGP